MFAVNRPWVSQYDSAKVWGGLLSVIAHIILFSLIFFQLSWDKDKTQDLNETSSIQLTSIEVLDSKSSQVINPAFEPKEITKEAISSNELPTPLPKEQTNNKAINSNENANQPTEINLQKKKLLDKNNILNLPKDKAENKTPELPQLAKVDKELAKVQNTSHLEKLNSRNNELSKELTELSQQKVVDIASKESANNELQALAQQKNKENSEYIGKIRNKIKKNINLPEIDSNPEVHYQLEILPDGTVVQPIKLIKSSGFTELDEAVERAILKSSPLPKPSYTMQRKIDLRYRPFEK